MYFQPLFFIHVSFLAIIEGKQDHFLIDPFSIFTGLSVHHAFY
jgi:hypothetical protein